MTVEEMFDLLFKRVEHGDEAHREWLRNEFVIFMEEHNLQKSIIITP